MKVGWGLKKGVINIFSIAEQCSSQSIVVMLYSLQSRPTISLFAVRRNFKLKLSTRKEHSLLPTKIRKDRTNWHKKSFYNSLTKNCNAKNLGFCLKIFLRIRRWQRITIKISKLLTCLEAIKPHSTWHLPLWNVLLFHGRFMLFVKIKPSKYSRNHGVFYQILMITSFAFTGNQLFIDIHHSLLPLLRSCWSEVTWRTDGSRSQSYWGVSWESNQVVWQAENPKFEENISRKEC